MIETLKNNMKKRLRDIDVSIKYVLFIIILP